ncbi:Putative membrane protein [Chlamydia avium 10DC88]|uniref:Membrane protein n=1 Tax=Chlamydia avium 10DC88 TaxID=1229831 RepID=W8JGP8_9CHLA|nr:Putative membrane protein [Chlamydia avium 10DC88]
MCCFGVVFAIFLKLCTHIAQDFSFPTLGLGSFFSSFSIICASAVIVHSLLKQESLGEIKKLRKTFYSNWKSLWLSLLVSMPFFLSMVLVSAIIVFSTFLSSLPWIGKFFHTLFIFIPYVSSTVLILLFLGAFVSLFFCIPALSDQERIDYMKLIHCFRGNILNQSLGFIIAILPLVLCSWLALGSFYLMSYLVGLSDMHTGAFLVEMLVLVIPVAFILTPAVAFFFNFSFDFYLTKHAAVDKTIMKG